MDRRGTLERWSDVTRQPFTLRFSWSMWPILYKVTLHTTCGLKGAGISFLSRLSQFKLRKKAWDLICRSPMPGWHPSLLLGFLVRNYTRQTQSQHRDGKGWGTYTWQVINIYDRWLHQCFIAGVHLWEWALAPHFNISANSTLIDTRISIMKSSLFMACVCYQSQVPQHMQKPCSIGLGIP